MRVAIFVLTLLGIAVSEAAFSQAVDVHDTPAFNSAMPAIAMNSPGLMLQELTVPALKDGTAASRTALGKQAKTTVPKSSKAKLPTATPAVLPSLSAAGAMAGRGAAMIQPHAGIRTYQQPSRSLSDHLLTGVVALMLIAYQLRRKHRVLRPHPFSY